MHKSLWFCAATFVAAVAANVPAAQSQTPTAPIDIPFARSITAPDLKIEQLSAVIVGTEARFTVKYETGRDRFLSFFDPPGGGVVRHMDRGALKTGAGEVTFAIPLDKLRQVGAITMGFGENNNAERDRNFVFLKLNAPECQPLFGDMQTKDKSARSRRAPAFTRVTTVNEVAPLADIRFKDVSGVAGLNAEKILRLRFNEATRWNAADAAVARDVLERGKNPGLGVRSLHRAGITGAGVSVGIIDQNILLDHPEFKERIARYKDVGCNADGGSMHGPAVASLLVGKNLGIAPGARLYFAAAPSWTKDTKFQAEALQWLLDVNAALPAAEKIRVISVSAAPSGDTSPFTTNKELWDAACDRATKAGVLVLDCTGHRGVIGPAYYDAAAPEDPARVTVGFPGRSGIGTPSDRVFVPCSGRTVAEEYSAGECSFQYTGTAGLSWSIPYAAGVLAMGWQVNPQLPPERMVALLRETAHVKDGRKIINPVAFIEAVKRP